MFWNKILVDIVKLEVEKIKIILFRLSFFPTGSAIAEYFNDWPLANYSAVAEYLAKKKWKKIQ